MIVSTALRAHINGITDEARAFKEEEPDEDLRSIIYYDARDETVVVPVDDILAQLDDCGVDEVIRLADDLLPQIRTRYGPAETVTVVLDGLCNGVPTILVHYADPTVTVVREFTYHVDAGTVTWYPPATWVGPTTGADALVASPLGRAVFSAFREEGTVN